LSSSLSWGPSWRWCCSAPVAARGMTDRLWDVACKVMATAQIQRQLTGWMMNPITKDEFAVIEGAHTSAKAGEYSNAVSPTFGRGKYSPRNFFDTKASRPGARTKMAPSLKMCAKTIDRPSVRSPISPSPQSHVYSTRLGSTRHKTNLPVLKPPSHSSSTIARDAMFTSSKMAITGCYTARLTTSTGCWTCTK
jgi:hypothetical protein